MCKTKKDLQKIENGIPIQNISRRNEGIKSINNFERILDKSRNSSMSKMKNGIGK